jgi:hypothetical protein
VDGSIDWLHFSKDVQEVMTEYWKDVDTILMGRKTYGVAAAQGQGVDEKPPNKTKRGTYNKPAIRTSSFRERSRPSRGRGLSWWPATQLILSETSSGKRGKGFA